MFRRRAVDVTHGPHNILESDQSGLMHASRLQYSIIYDDLNEIATIDTEIPGFELSSPPAARASTEEVLAVSGSLSVTYRGRLS
jgi:hypothetical protein